MDRKRQTFFRGAHPTRYQADAVSLATTIRSKSLAGAGQTMIVDRQSVAASERSEVSQRLQAMSTRASGNLMDAHRMSNTGTRTKPGLKEFLKDNEKYAQALEKINQKLALKDAMDRAAHEFEESKKGTSQMGA